MTQNELLELTAEHARKLRTKVLAKLYHAEKAANRMQIAAVLRAELQNRRKPGAWRKQGKFPIALNRDPE